MERCERPLTPAQQRVYEMLAEGKRIPEIARELGRSQGTIRTYQRQIKSRLRLPRERQRRVR